MRHRFLVPWALAAVAFVATAAPAPPSRAAAGDEERAER